MDPSRKSVCFKRPKGLLLSICGDRETFNFCEEFKPRIASSPTTKTRRLLGEDEPEKKKGFGSLFKDDGQ